MKKTMIMLGVMVACLFLMPSVVHAAQFVDPDSDGVYVNDTAISMGRYGTIAAGDASWTYSDEAEGEKTWTFSFSTSSSYIYFQLVPTSVDIEGISVNTSNGFMYISQPQISGGIQPVLIQSANSSATTLTVTVITTDTADTGCMLDVSPQELSCTVVNGLYFDDDGNNVTAEQYNEICGGATTPNDGPNDIPNSETGSVVPYIAIGGGLVAIVAVYLISRKSNKVYKI